MPTPLRPIWLEPRFWMSALRDWKSAPMPARSRIWMLALQGEPAPAIGLGHFARITLIEAHAGQNRTAGGLDPPGQSQAIAIRLDLRTRHREQRDIGAPSVEQAGEFLHFHQAELRRREHDEIDRAGVVGIVLRKGTDIGVADFMRRQG